MYFHADIDHAPTSRYIRVLHDARARKDALETEHEPKGGLGHGYDPSRERNHHHVLGRHAWGFRCWFMIVPFWTGRRGFARLCGLLRSEMASRMPGVSGLGEGAGGGALKCA